MSGFVVWQFRARGRAWIEQACHVLVWKLPTNRFQTTEAPHRSLYVWNPRGSPRGLPLCRVPNRNPLQTQGLPTSKTLSREAPHKQGDQGGSPQAELRPGSPPTTRITTRELAVAGWLAGGISKLASWLAVGLAGWLAKAQKGRERPREAQRGTEKRSVDRTSLSCAWLRRWGLPTSRFTTREARHRVLM